MRSREKFFWQTLIGLIAALYLAFSVSESSALRTAELFIRWVTSGFSNQLPPQADLPTAAGTPLPLFAQLLQRHRGAGQTGANDVPRACRGC